MTKHHKKRDRSRSRSGERRHRSTTKRKRTISSSSDSSDSIHHDYKSRDGKKFSKIDNIISNHDVSCSRPRSRSTSPNIREKYHRKSSKKREKERSSSNSSNERSHSNHRERSYQKELKERDEFRRSHKKSRQPSIERKSSSVSGSSHFPFDKSVSEKHAPQTCNSSHKRRSDERSVRQKEIVAIDDMNKDGHSRSLINKGVQEATEVESEESNSEEEIMFDWESHKYELNVMFFQDHDIIRRGSEDYHDFFKFLRKYQAIQKQKKIQSVVAKHSNKSKGQTRQGGDDTAAAESSKGSSSKFNLPVAFNNRYLVNFAVKGDSVDTRMRRLPPLDLEEKNTRLSKKRVEEFKNIVLLYLNFVQRKNFEKLQKLRKSQSELPIAKYRDAIVKTVADNSIVLIAGDTGCGKSTQVPQYLMKAGYSNVACTQPRRIACISLCKRVAYESLNEYGTEVGYQIRFERKRTEHTKILFLTEGLLLRQVNLDPSLGSYDVVILDEIHERHLHTDFLLGVIKCLLMQRTQIKIILMSATINLTLFSSYFLGKAPIIQVPGRLYPIKLNFFPIPIIEQTTKSDKLNPAPFVRVLQLIDNKYSADERGDVLMFLSGFSEINTVVEAAKLYAQQSRKWVILSLHSNLSISDQEKVFDIPPEGIRKCIVSTNIAETSITIDGVRFVVDSGKVKEMSYDPVCKMQKLKEFWVSQASAEQRKGRAGRTGPGVCFRLYSEEKYDSLDPYSTPEIQRVPLDSLALQMIAMGLPDIRLFPFIEPPPLESLEVSIKVLKCQSAITPSEQLTTTGRLLSQLPVDVTIGKMLIMGTLFHQAEASLSLAASMSVQSVLTNRSQRDPDCVAALQEIISHHGDPFTLLNAYKAWLEEKSLAAGREEESRASRRWCRTRGLEEQRFYELTKLRHQFSQLLQQSKLQESPVADDRSSRTAAERARRHGELQQLRQLRRQAEKQATRKTKVLKINQDGDAMSDGEADTATLDPKHLEFNIKNDAKQLRNLLKNSDVQSFKDVIMLKVVLSSGLYPNVAIADEHNNYKPNSEQMFHTPSKPFAALHPTSVFAKQPEVLQLSDADIVELPDFNSRNPAATKHQLLLYVSLLETNKPFLLNTFRVPTAQTLFLFAQNIDTNADMSTLVFDNFIELRFPDATVAQNLIMQSVQLRVQWNKLLELKLQLSHDDVDVLDILSAAGKLERVLSYGLVEMYMAEPLFSQRRLLAADVKLLHKGPGPDDAVLDTNPFTDGEVCVANESKGGVNLTENITYNSLLETQCDVTTLSVTETACVVCDEVLTCTVLGRLQHMVHCTQEASNKRNRDTDKEEGSDNPNAKKYYCEHCEKNLWLTLTEIFAHKKTHN